MRLRKSLCLAMWSGVAAASFAAAQSISPVISEYKEKASGSFAVTNDTGIAMAVLLEPKSFSIDETGKGSFRNLDPVIHLAMSTSSLRLEPRETATVFYKISVDVAPQWLSIYAVFSPLRANPGLNVRIMLPHTVYVYQKEELQREAIRIDAVNYDAARHRVECLLTNESERAGRATGVDVEGVHASADAPGFPLLPHQPRRVSIEWSSQNPPKTLEVDFARFTIKNAVNAISELAPESAAQPLPGQESP